MNIRIFFIILLYKKYDWSPWLQWTLTSQSTSVKWHQSWQRNSTRESSGNTWHTWHTLTPSPYVRFSLYRSRGIGYPGGHLHRVCKERIWAATWQNQQNECAPSEDSDAQSDQSSLLNNMKKSWVLSYPLSTQRRLIRLGMCPGWSESSLGAVILLVLSCRGSYTSIDNQNRPGNGFPWSFMLPVSSQEKKVSDKIINIKPLRTAAKTSSSEHNACDMSIV